MKLDDFILREEMFLELYEKKEDQIKDLPGYATAKAEHRHLLRLLKELKKLRERCKQKCSTCKYDENDEYEFPCNMCKFSYSSRYKPKGDDEE